MSDKTAVVIDEIGMQKLLEFMKANQKTEQANDMESLVNSIHSIESTLLSTMEEIQKIKVQYNIDQPTPISEQMQNQMKMLEEKVKSLLEMLASLKDKLMSKVNEIVSVSKDNGIKALDKVSEFIHLKDGLQTFNDAFKDVIKMLDKEINTLNAVTMELNAATKHIANAGKAIIGVERNNEPAKPNDIVTMPTKAFKKTFEVMEKASQNAIDKVDKLSEKASTIEKKPSVLNEIKENKEKIAEKTALKVTPKPKDKSQDMAI